MKEFDEYLKAVGDCFGGSDDFVSLISGEEGARLALAFVRGITSRDYISERILRPLLREDISAFDGDMRSVIESPFLSECGEPCDAAESCAKGDVLVLIESKNGFFKALANAAHTPGRSIQEPSSDVTVRGPKAGFVEDAETNMALIRRYIRTPSLRFVRREVGSVSQTRVVIAYVEGRADRRLVEDIDRRISRLDASVITDSANLAMLLEGRRYACLPSCGSTEKVDKTASKLMAGRIAIIVDGSPFVLTLPFLFVEGLQASDDYLHTPFYATFIRVLRLIAFVVAIFAPAILCAAVNHNYEVIPQSFYGIISESRQDIPLSFFWEVLGILLLFELLREVGVRMPRTVGDVVGIVGSIILGNTAVEAGIVSSVGVITVALAAVCAFITPAYMYVIVLARLLTLVAAELLGIKGIVLSAVTLFVALCFKRSFGAHYMFPLVPFSPRGMQDHIFCAPKRTLGRREDIISEGNDE